AKLFGIPCSRVFSKTAGRAGGSGVWQTAPALTVSPAYPAPAPFLSPPAVVHRSAHEVLPCWHSGLGEGTQGGNQMDFYTLLDHVIDLLRQRQRVTYRALKVQFHLDDEGLEALKEELVYGQRLATEEDGRVMIWTGDTGPTAPPSATPVQTSERLPLTYTPSYLAEKILTSRSALEGERKQVTVLFADLKGSTELIRDLDPEAAQHLLDPALQHM